MIKLISALRDAFSWIEQRGMRVGLVVLHPNEALQLRNCQEDFDVNAHPELEGLCGFGRLVGHLWGADVIELETIVPGHAMVIPDGLTVTGVDCCFSLGLNMPDQPKL